MARAALKDANAELSLERQEYGADPLADRETDLYRGEYIMSFVEKWDELIDWRARAESEGQFFIDVLRARGKETVLDVAAGTGFHSVRLTEAGFNVTTADGSAAMVAKAFENGQSRGLILKTVQADWRWLNRDIQGKYDAIICLGNSFTHLHDEADRRRALAEFYAALKHDGILILDQRNYDAMLDEGFSSKHKFYYCGDKVTAEPAHIDEGLCRMLVQLPGWCGIHAQPVSDPEELRAPPAVGGRLPARAHLWRFPRNLRRERAGLLHPCGGKIRTTPGALGRRRARGR